jgi:hypothetical protein
VLLITAKNIVSNNQTQRVGLSDIQFGLMSLRAFGWKRGSFKLH